MIYTNEKIIFIIPTLKSEWILPVVISYEDNCFYVSNQHEKTKGKPIFKATIFHTITGDINRFDVTCRDFTIEHDYFNYLLKPIFEKYCNENIIDLKFDSLYI
jgi:hypothetical protein